MKPDGGPAFPLNEPFKGSGMSLRDYFAAAALQGITKDRENVNRIADIARDMNKDEHKQLAEICFSVADAMLAERSK